MRMQARIIGRNHFKHQTIVSSYESEDVLATFACFHRILSGSDVTGDNSFVQTASLTGLQSIT